MSWVTHQSMKAAHNLSRTFAVWCGMAPCHIKPQTSWNTAMHIFFQVFPDSGEVLCSCGCVICWQGWSLQNREIFCFSLTVLFHAKQRIPVALHRQRFTALNYLCGKPHKHVILAYLNWTQKVTTSIWQSLPVCNAMPVLFSGLLWLQLKEQSFQPSWRPQ